MAERLPIFSPAHAALWMMGALLCMVLLLGTASALNPGVIDDQVSLGALSAVSFLIVTSLLLGRYPGGATLRKAIGARAVHPMLLPLAACIGFLAQAPAERLRDFVHHLWPGDPNSEPAGIVLTTGSPFEAFALVLVLVGLVPLAEEVFFRGAVYGALRRSQSSARWAAIISAVGFTLCHVNARLLLPIGLVAAIFGFLRGSSGSLYPSLVAHMAFNAVPVVSSLQAWSSADDWAKRYGVEIFVALCGALATHWFIAQRSGVAQLGRDQEAEPYLVPDVERRS